MYYTIQNGSLLKAETEQALTRYYNNVKPLPVDYEDGKYIVDGDDLVLNPNYEAEQELKERERIAKLNLTGADVERGIYQAKGMDFEDIVELVETLIFAEAPQVQGIDLKALKIELKANHFYRGSEYVSKVGALLGFTSEQLDKFFKTNDYTTLLSQSDKVEGESDKVSDTVEEPVKVEVEE